MKKLKPCVSLPYCVISVGLVDSNNPEYSVDWFDTDLEANAHAKAQLAAGGWDVHVLLCLEES